MDTFETHFKNCPNFRFKNQRNREYNKPIRAKIIKHNLFDLFMRIGGGWERISRLNFSNKTDKKMR